jgi:hypothetical protein
MRSTAAFALAALTAGTLSLRVVNAETATVDSLDIQHVGEELIAIRDASAPSRIRLEKREKVQWLSAKGIVGVALTDRRFLAVSPASPGWQEARLRSSDGHSPQVRLAANVALLITSWRILGFDGRSGLLAESRLTPQETLLASDAEEHVAVVVTNRRVLGWASGFGGPVDQPLGVLESFQSLRVLGKTASVRTSKRVLIFSGSNGLWRDEALGPD